MIGTVALVVSVAGMSGAAAAPEQSTSTVWLCRPGLADNPCESNLGTTIVRADGSTSVVLPKPAKHPPIDCFYVYPTVSGQQRSNADLTIDPEEIAVAEQQASRFSQVCRVFAPMYRQITIRGLLRGAFGSAAAHRDRVPRGARRLARLPRARQPRARRCVHRPLAGIGDADQAPPQRDRPEAGAAPPDGLRAAARRRRHRRHRKRRRWFVPTNHRVPRREPDRVRRRVLQLRRHTTGRLAVRAGRVVGL